MGRYVIQILRVGWFIIKYALILGVIALVLILIMLSGAYRDLKAVATDGLAGKQEATTAVNQVKARDWSGADKSATQAQEHFTASLASLDKVRSNPAAKNVPLIKQQINDLEYLLKTGEILTRSLQRTIPLVEQAQTIQAGGASSNFVDLSTADKQRFLKLLYESGPELSGLNANLDLALLNLDKIHKIGILWPVYSQISDIKSELTQAADLMDKAVPLANLLPALAGYPETSRFLIILQNNDELRPSGGFIGVYAILEIQNGEIISLKTDDSYHLDMPASLSDKWTKEPPAPIKKYLKVEKWYFRDANWSPDWPTSAQQIEEIYQGELVATGQPTPTLTGVMAINPDFVSDLISLVGPITVRGETYTADNLQSLLQYNVEVAYKEQNISSWNRKDVINELVAELKARLFRLPSQQWTTLLSIADSNISERNLQLFLNNSNWQTQTRSLQAGGEVKKTAGDYLMVVDSNFGAFKSDVVVKKDITYSVAPKNGKLTAAAKLSYRHEGDFDWRTTRYRSYTRIYAPLGSKLQSLAGLDEATQDLSVIDDEELGKTIFGFFLTVEPGTTREITVNYELPDSLNRAAEAGTYELFVQKQSGNRIKNLELNFSFDKSIKKASLPSLRISGKKAALNTDLNIDRPLTIYFK